MRSLWLTVFHVSVTWSHEFEAARIVASTQQIPKQEFNVHPYLQNGAKWLTLLWSESTQLTMDKADPVLYYLHHPAPSTHSILMLPPKERGLEIQFPPSSGSKGAAWRFHKFFQVVLFWLVILSMKKSQVGVTLCQLEYQDILQVRSAFLRRWEWAAKLVGGLASYVPWIPVEKGGNWHGKILLERYQALKCLASGKQFLSVLSH